MTVTVYSTTTCPFCNMLKSYLHEHKIEFQEKMVDQDDAAKDEMVRSSGGFLGVPFTIVEKNGSKDTIIGFDKNKVNQVLGIS
jgi:glutaredoxin 3